MAYSTKDLSEEPDYGAIFQITHMTGETLRYVLKSPDFKPQKLWGNLNINIICYIGNL